MENKEFNQENYELLYKALSAYLPYDLIVTDKNDKPVHLIGISPYWEHTVEGTYFCPHGIVTKPLLNALTLAFDNNPMLWTKPYLRHEDDLTDEEKKEIPSISLKHTDDYGRYDVKTEEMMDVIKWCLKKHIDIFGLIEKGLAIRVTKNNNPYEEK